MNPIRLIATDMDGTLLDQNGQVPAGFMPWVQAHPQTQVVIASGRQVHTLVQQFAPIKDQLIFVSDNGALVMSQGRILSSVPLDAAKAQTCLEVFSAVPGCIPIVCGVKTAYVSAATAPSARASIEQYYLSLTYVKDLAGVFEQDTVVKIAVYFHEGPAPQDEPWRDDIPSGLKAQLTSDYWCDIADESVNKGKAVRALQDLLGISPAECMAFGDYLNDLTLLQACQESYCMANGVDALKAVAKYQAPSCCEDGVMQVLRQWDAVPGTFA